MTRMNKDNTAEISGYLAVLGHLGFCGRQLAWDDDFELTKENQDYLVDTLNWIYIIADCLKNNLENDVPADPKILLKLQELYDAKYDDQRSAFEVYREQVKRIQSQNKEGDQGST